MKAHPDYIEFYKNNIIKFSFNRLLPYIGMAAIGVLIANKNFDEFSFFSYIASAFVVPATVATFTFFAMGNLISDESDPQGKVIFNSILLLATVFSGLSGLTCVGIIHLSVAEMSAYLPEYRSESLAYYYVLYIMLYIFSSFFNTYYETWAHDRTSFIGRAIGFAIISIGGVTSYYQMDSMNYSYHMVMLMTVGALLEVTYYVFIGVKKRLFSLNIDRQTIVALLRIGLPSSLGISLQRFSFFLVNKRLLLIDKDFVSLFSVAISVVVLLAIPVSAFVQIHSIYVTRNRAIKLNTQPITLLITTLLPPTVVFVAYDRTVLNFFGISDRLLEKNALYSLSIVAVLFTTSILMMLTSHLRAYERTHAPQLIMNLSMYGIYLGTVYSGILDNKPPLYLLFTYATTLIVCLVAIILHERINLLNPGIPRHSTVTC
jgi:Na+-driven multidrug efflux pump